MRKSVSIIIILVVNYGTLHSLHVDKTLWLISIIVFYASFVVTGFYLYNILFLDDYSAPPERGIVGLPSTGMGAAQSQSNTNYLYCD